MLGQPRGKSDRSLALPGTIRHGSRSSGPPQPSPPFDEPHDGSNVPATSPTAVEAAVSPAAGSRGEMEPDTSTLNSRDIIGNEVDRVSVPPEPVSPAPAHHETVSPVPPRAVTPASPVPLPTPPSLLVIAGSGDRGRVEAAEADVLPPGLSPNVKADDSVPPSRTAKFQRLFDAKSIDIDALRKLAWSGVPRQYRIHTWQLLLVRIWCCLVVFPRVADCCVFGVRDVCMILQGYLPSQRDRHVGSVDKKRQDYRTAVSQCFGPAFVKNDKEQALLRQVLVDLPRTCPGIPLFHTEFVQRVGTCCVF
jgi:hypothetical protein